MRMQHSREVYIPKGAKRFHDRQSSAMVAAYEKDGKFYLVGFHGRAQKPDFHYWYRTPEQREEKARRTFEARRLTEQFKADQAAKRKVEDVRKLEVGDILRASWGYDQTNIDYYQVTALIGKAMVEIREIGGESVESECASMQGKCVPSPGKFIGEPMRKMAQGDGVRIKSFMWARKIEPRAVIGGKPVFDADHWTAYA